MPAPTVPTAYTVVVTDSAGYTGQAMVRVSPIDVPTVAPEARVVRLRERLVRFAATVGAGPVSALRWDFGDGSALDSSASPTHAYPRPGTYAARLTVRYGPACAVAVAVPVVVPDLVLPNVITPNHDELNDTFRPVVSTGPVGLRVYNRWGALVFEQTAYAGDWGDGVAAGTYYYRLTADNENWQGWLEVVR
ncbi:MAG: gliding motility-associated C-terminal domain-containing protein [Hymenobacteraceae bacterium]|nr:gliding motility-associated C-terminal domain-containing protein [Hymenobacteraceae bacterium]